MSAVHGTKWRYAKGCRCDECRAVKAAYQRAWRASRGASLIEMRRSRDEARRRREAESSTRFAPEGGAA